MKKTFDIFITGKDGEDFKMCRLLTSLSRRGKKFTITPWASNDGTQAGFVVWYFV